MTLTIKSFIASNGERFSQLYSDAEAFPLFYPTAFIARSIRMKTKPGTQKVYLEAIKRLCEWEAKENMDLVERFQQHEFLLLHEIDSLAQYLNAARRGRSENTISASKGNTYVSYAAQYLGWLAHEVITDTNDPEVRSLINTQHRRLADKLLSKPGSQSAKAREILKKHLPDKAREQLRALWDGPFLEIFRPADRGSRLRSVVMLRILYETGMRRGELLSLKLKNLLESTGGAYARLVIEKNHHDVYDTRVEQPVAKTEGRIVPITADAEQQLSDYITYYRADVPGVGFDDEDFIFVTHRGRAGQGKPLSISNADQALTSLKNAFPALKGTHYHLFRHDWNYRFSTAADDAKMDPIKEAELRRILMGWSDKSDMPRTYNLRHLQEEAASISLRIADDTARPAPPSEQDLAAAKKLALVVANTK